eukprot:277385-Amphidinium_carterae.1
MAGVSVLIHWMIHPSIRRCQRHRICMFAIRHRHSDSSEGLRARGVHMDGCTEKRGANVYELLVLEAAPIVITSRCIVTAHHLFL